MFEFIKIIELIFRTFVAISNPWMPRSLRMRIIFGFWLAGFIFINAFIQTKFIATLMKPGFESEITTHEELLNSKLDKIIPNP